MPHIRLIRRILGAALSLALVMAALLEYRAPAAQIVLAEPPMEADSGSGVTLPVILYHKLLKSRSDAYTVKPSLFEDDLKYLRDNGYETVVISDLAAYVHQGVPLPEKPVMITFDDGYYNNYHYAYPLLKEYGMRAVIAIVGEYADEATKSGDINPNYSYLTWEHIKELSETGVFEFANHSYHMHNTKGKRYGASMCSDESAEAYAGAVTTDLSALQQKLMQATGQQSFALAYPFGSVSEASKPLIKDLGFAASLTSRKGLNYIDPSDPDTLFLLCRNDRTPGMSMEDFMREIGG